MTEVSIVIPSTGNEKKLQQILRSIQSQVDVVFEVIIVVNGINIDNRKIYDHWQKGLPKHINFHFLDQRGVNLARNYGLKVSKSEIVLFLDDDCVLPSERFLSAHVQYHRRYKNVVAFGGGYQIPVQSQFVDKMYNQRQMHWLFAGLQNSDLNYHLLGGNFSVKKEKLLESNIEFDNKIIYGGSEFDFFKKIESCKMESKYIDLPVMHITSESFFSLIRKMYKQGVGKAIIDERYCTSNTTENDLLDSSMKIKEKLFHIFLNCAFWFGYYNEKNNYIGILKHLFRVLISYINIKRYKLLKLLENSFSKKKNDGDRF